ncbi:hypothetical protein B9G99_00215 [Kushneria konosiri]|uniref:Uncharacterized protein n=2 Tax=Kushneria konosiri TaxID=698828 RepID=A0A2Z2H918_9GAMM|nr:hypothetical protein B9G99_00215 [Kushneria konosiri]
MIRILGMAEASEQQRQQAAEQLVLAAIEAEVDYRLFEEDTRIGYPSISPTATLGNVPGCGSGGYDTMEWECEHMAQRSHVAQLGQQLLADLPARALAAVMLTAYPTAAPKGPVDEERLARAPREVTLGWVVKHQFQLAERMGLGRRLHVRNGKLVTPWAAFPTDQALKKAASRVRQCLADRVLMIFSKSEELAA